MVRARSLRALVKTRAFGMTPRELCAERILADDLLLEADRAGAAWRTFDAVAELADIDLQLGDGAAESVAVHAQFARGAALVAFVLLKNGEDKALLEFPHTLGVKDVAAVHLQNQCFQLIFHDAFSLLTNFLVHRRLFRLGSRGAA